MNEGKVKELKESMELLETQTTNIKKLREGFEETLKELIADRKDTETALAGIKTVLTAEALEEFKESGEKKLYGGIGIRESPTLSYPADKALEFAKEKGMFLSLDKKSFDKVADSLGLDFVTTGKKTTVTFPKVVKL